VHANGNPSFLTRSPVAQPRWRSTSTHGPIHACCTLRASQAGLYEGQGKCSQVLAETRALGFRPIMPVHCTPVVQRSHGWRTTAWGCELDILFTAFDVPPPPDEIARFHSVGMSGCNATVQSFEAAPNGSLVMTKPFVFQRQVNGKAEGKSLHAPPPRTPYFCLTRYPRRSHSHSQSHGEKRTFSGGTIHAFHSEAF